MDMDYSETPRMRVSRGRGEVVAVKVWDRDGDVDNVTYEGFALNWRQIDGIAITQGVPPKLIIVDDDAAAFLGPRPGA
jgi:hypothetical protein